MIIAGKDLHMGGGVMRKKGEPVPEALTWSYPVFRAELNQGNILDPENIGQKHFQGKSPTPPKLAERMGEKFERVNERMAARVEHRGDHGDEMDSQEAEAGTDSTEVTEAESKPQKRQGGRGKA